MTAFGFLNVNKPAGMTSHDVVAAARRGLRVKKIGHAGTLDPMASGVLVLCLGPATRLSEYVMHTTKRYRAEICLGVETDTYDADGAVTAQRDASHITQDDVVQALGVFVGEIDQVPPMYSAIKQGGRKLYDMARKGHVVEREARPVTIHTLEVSTWSLPRVTVDVTCGPGTYIRSLAHDLGAALGVGAHLTALTRLASGAFTLEDAVALDALLADADWTRYVVAPGVALAGWPVVDLDAAALTRVIHGQVLVDARAAAGTLAQGRGPDGAFAAVLEGDGTQWRPTKVFVSQD